VIDYLGQVAINSPSPHSAIVFRMLLPSLRLLEDNSARDQEDWCREPDRASTCQRVGEHKT
jgi:hypothetical protein